MSKLVNKFSLGLTVAVGVALVAYYQSDSTIEDVGEQIALKLLEILPRKSKIHQQQQFRQEPAFEREKPVFREPSPPPPKPTNNETKDRQQPPPSVEQEEVEEEEELSKASIFDPVGYYNPKEAMQRRHDNLREACMQYGDFMRPERIVTEAVPELDDMLLHPPSQTLFCTLDVVAKKSLNTFFTRIKEPGGDWTNKIKSFNNGFPRSAARFKNAVVVRHPLERIVAAYRSQFERSYNAATGQEEGGDVSFPEFVDVVLNGHVEFAEFLEENGLGASAAGGTGAGSAAIDTGLIDGTSGPSRKWNPFWRQCGVCHPDFMPHFILHLDHFKEDSAVLVEVMGHPRNSKEFIGVEVEPKSGIREVEEHYWSQVTKQDVRDLYEKYKVDHELFGFAPDYYVAMARDDGDEGFVEDGEQ